MKKTSFVFCALCALIIIFSAAACNSVSSENEKKAVPPKQTADSNEIDNSFILGDADCDGEITINDVTLIQRVIAEIVKDTDGKITQRSDINGNGLDIFDVTLIMRFIAGYHDVNAIGQKISINQTQPATEKPSDFPDATVGVSSQISEEETSKIDDDNNNKEQETTFPESNQPTTNAPQTKPSSVESTTSDLTLGENDLPFDNL